MSVSRDQSVKNQVLADWFGLDSDEDETSNIHSIEAIVAVIREAFESSSGLEEAQLIEAWRRAVGDFTAQHATLNSITKGVARVRVLQPSMRFHLEQLRGVLLAKLQLEFPQEMIQKILFSAN